MSESAYVRGTSSEENNRSSSNHDRLNDGTTSNLPTVVKSLSLPATQQRRISHQRGLPLKKSVHRNMPSNLESNCDPAVPGVEPGAGAGAGAGSVIHVHGGIATDVHGLVLFTLDSDAFFLCDAPIPNGYASCCCPCVPLAQTTARLGIAPFYVTLFTTGVLFVASVTLLYLSYYNRPLEGNERVDLDKESNRESVGNSSNNSNNYNSSSSSSNTHFKDSNNTTLISTTERPTPWRTLDYLESPRLESNYFLAALGVMSILVFSITVLRRRIRKLFLIPGHVMMDGLLACCCFPCAVAQMATHVRSYEPGIWYFGAPTCLPGYSTKSKSTTRYQRDEVVVTTRALQEDMNHVSTRISVDNA